MGHFDRYWEMRVGGPHDGESADKVFKCKDCGAETYHQEGWNGEPDPSLCKHGCSSRASDWRPGRVSGRFRKNLEAINFEGQTKFANAVEDVSPAIEAKRLFANNFDAIFPNAPGAGL